MVLLSSLGHQIRVRTAASSPSPEEGIAEAGLALLCTLIPDLHLLPALALQTVPHTQQGSWQGWHPSVLSEELSQLAQKSRSLFTGCFLVVGPSHGISLG